VRRDGSRLLSRSDAKRINAIILTLRHLRRGRRFCLPSRSTCQERHRWRHPGHHSGALLRVRVEPGLDDKGNSIAGITALDAFTTLTGWSVF
jgi:glutaminase